jgi:hypothetical protein
VHLISIRFLKCVQPGLNETRFGTSNPFDVSIRCSIDPQGSAGSLPEGAARQFSFLVGKSVSRSIALKTR